VVKVGPTNLEFDNDIFCVEYESFSYASNEIESFDVRFCVEYESFFFDLIITYPLFEPSKCKFLEYETFIPMTADLDQTLEHTKIKRLVNLGPTNVPRFLIHDDRISRSMTHFLLNFEYISLFDVWVRQFDKLKQALLVLHCY